MNRFIFGALLLAASAAAGQEPINPWVFGKPAARPKRSIDIKPVQRWRWHLGSAGNVNELNDVRRHLIETHGYTAQELADLPIGILWAIHDGDHDGGRFGAFKGRLRGSQPATSPATDDCPT